MRQVQHQPCGTGDLAFHVAGEFPAVRRVHLAPDGDEHRGVRQVAGGEHRSMVYLTAVDGPRIGAEQTTRTHCSHGWPPSVETGMASGIGPYVFKASHSGSSAALCAIDVTIGC